MRAKCILQNIWCGPATLIGLAYVAFCSAMGWYQWHARFAHGLIWHVRPVAPVWLLRWWAKRGGHTIGQVVVLAPWATLRTVVHELEHVRQCRVLGPFALVYGVIWLTIKVACPRSDAYHDNPLEREARRASGEEEL